jgi:hypothetical protein
MGQVYTVGEAGRTEAMNRIRCTNEDRELQRLLDKNYDLLPGDQIDPEDPRRWLLVKREMPVPDPSTGSDRWRIDFFLLDQDAVPTFVECKRFQDTRSRREVVGQMLEYAANGHHYWTRELMRELTEASAQQRSLSLEEALQSLRPSDDLSVDTFFERAEENLRQGQVRIVFFMEESPMELRSVVDFLNKQMERSEVLLVEARQYAAGAQTIVVPVLFGYTEQARLAKRSVTVKTAESRRKWDKDSFFADANGKLGPAHVRAIESLYESCLALGCEISWGTGRETGSFSAKDLALAQRSIITVYSNGTLSFNFGWLNDNARTEALRDRLKDLVVERLGIRVPSDYVRKFRTVIIDEWADNTAIVAQLLGDVISEFREAAV